MNKRFGELPTFLRAVLAGLNFSSPDFQPLSELSQREWTRVLGFCDPSQLTLPLYLRCRDHFPAPIGARAARNLMNNGARWETLKSVYGELALALDEQQLPYLVLKGFSQWPMFVADPRHRVQYDIDLLLRPEQICEAAEVAARLGYQAVHSSRDQRPDHLPPMIRRTGWRWRGDYFDPEIPFSLELHFRTWNFESEHFGSRNLEATFWGRALRRRCEQLSFPCLHPADAILYASMHAVRHLLHGNLRPSHVYEMAYLLHSEQHNDALWQEWSGMHDRASQLQQAICFSLAHLWFECSPHKLPAALIHSVPAQVAAWLELYAYSPLTATFKPNKDEVWLHWALVESKQERFAVLRRKFAPQRLPGPVDAVHTKPGELTWRIRLASQWRYLSFVTKRVSHHIRAFTSAACSAIRWFGKLRATRSLT